MWSYVLPFFYLCVFQDVILDTGMPAHASGTSAGIVLVLDSTLSSLRLKLVCLMTQTGESKGMLTVSNSGSSAPDH
jgi:hypothetical protein